MLVRGRNSRYGKEVEDLRVDRSSSENVQKKKTGLKSPRVVHRHERYVYPAYTRYVFNGLNANEKRCGLVVAKGRVDWKHRCDNRSRRIISLVRNKLGTTFQNSVRIIQEENVST